MAEQYPFVLRPLPYDYDALEPHISTSTMYLHHDKHLAAYVENLNKALAPYPRFHNWTLTELLYSLGRLPRELQTAVRNNGGGVYNHNLYFSGMSPAARAGKPVGVLAQAINRQLGGYEAFIKQMKDSAVSRFGSGWAWLVTDAEGRLQILSTPNQDTPLYEFCPVLLVDVWEHAYYLDYQNRRPDYFDNWTQVINWPLANERYIACTGMRPENL